MLRGDFCSTECWSGFELECPFWLLRGKNGIFHLLNTRRGRGHHDREKCGLEYTFWTENVRVYLHAPMYKPSKSLSNEYDFNMLADYCYPDPKLFDKLYMWYEKSKGHGDILDVARA